MDFQDFMRKRAEEEAANWEDYKLPEIRPTDDPFTARLWSLTDLQLARIQSRLESLAHPPAPPVPTPPVQGTTEGYGFHSEAQKDKVRFTLSWQGNGFCSILLTQDEVDGLVSGLREARDGVREWRRENPSDAD